jgi:LPXTG-motif cell wall-anchored protein
MSKIVTIIAFILLAVLAAPSHAQGQQPGQSGDMMLSASLSGTQEVPNPGDPDGTGTAMITLRTTNEVCWDLKVSNITLPAAAAHIHAGEPGVAGPVVVPLSAPDANGMAMGCTNGDAAVVDRIRQNPAAFYVNVHTPDFQAGAVRGQLMMGTAPQQPAPQQPAPQQPAPQQPAPQQPAPQQPAPAQDATPARLPNTGAGQSILPLILGAALALATGLLFVRRSRVSN